MESDNPRAALTPEDAAASLDVVDQTRAQLADRLVTPRWYHPILGAIEAGLIVSLDLPRPWSFVLLILALAGLAALIGAYTRVTGLGTGGDYAKLAGGWVIGLVLLILATLTAVLVTDQLWVTIVAAAVAFVATITFGRRADATVRARLRAGVRTGR